MRTRTASLGALLSVAAVAMCFAGNPTEGTWTLDESKSTLGDGAGKSVKVVWEKAGDQEKCTVDGVDAAGKKTHSVWAGKLDGKDYPLEGIEENVTDAYSRVDDHTYRVVLKVDGKPATTSTISISADGKTMTVVSSSSNTAVYSKRRLRTEN